VRRWWGDAFILITNAERRKKIWIGAYIKNKSSSLKTKQKSFKGALKLEVPKMTKMS
jgi:hypothetical protein